MTTPTYTPSRADEQTLDNVIPYSDPVFEAKSHIWNPHKLNATAHLDIDPWIVSGDQIALYKAGVRGIREQQSHAVSPPYSAGGGWDAHCLECDWRPSSTSRDGVRAESTKHRLEVTR